MHHTLIFVKFFLVLVFGHILELNILIAQIYVLFFSNYALFYYYGSSETTCTGKIISLISYEFQNHFVNYSHLELPSDTFRQSMPCK